MTNRDELAQNILHRIDEFLVETSGPLELMRVKDMILEEIDRFDIIRISPVTNKT